MKKILLISILILFWWTSNANCVEFQEWEICLNIENKWEWKYNVSKDTNMQNKENYYILSCEVLKPNNRLENIWACNQSFEYTWNWKQDVRYDISLQQNSKALETSHYFVHLSQNQYNDLEYVNNIWNELETTLEERYSELKDHDKWQQLSSNIQTNLNNLLNAKNSEFNSYDDVKEAVLWFAKFTQEITQN